MHTVKPTRKRRSVGAAVGVAFAAVLLSACGSSSGPSASNLLGQTFTGSHEISSGVVSLSLSITPSGSSLLSGPISLSFGGPFQSRGSGRLPESDFTASVSALGRSGSLGIISTGTSGYVTMSGTGYPLPPASFEKLESGFSGLGGSGSHAGAGTLGALGIDPLSWLQNATVVGSETVGGVATTHIHAGVDVDALLANLSTLLSKTSGVGVKGVGKLPASISPSQQAKLAAEIRSPSVDIWTGESDKTLRKLEVQLSVPLSGRDASDLGGARSLRIDLTLQYSDLNQPQTISVPATIKPYSVLVAKLNALTSELRGVIALGAAGGSGPSSSSSSSSSSGAAGAVGRYSLCVKAAAGNVAKLQKCASLLNK